MTGSVKINILGKEYTIKSDREESYVKQLGEYLNQKVEEVYQTTKTVATLNVLILTAMNIANDYFKEKMLARELIDAVEQKSKDLINYIDSNL